MPKFDPSQPIGYAGPFVETAEIIVVETTVSRGLYTKDGKQIVLFAPRPADPPPAIESAPAEAASVPAPSATPEQ